MSPEFPSSSSTARPKSRGDNGSPAQPLEEFHRVHQSSDPLTSVLFQAWRLILRPPRSIYSRSCLGPDSLRVLLPCQKGSRRVSKPFFRQDVRLRNTRGHILECSHFQPIDTDVMRPRLPCVIFCHGSSSCRIDAFQVMPSLLQYDMTMFCFDFAGSGLSGGDHVTLGYREEEDVRTVIDYLVQTQLVSSIGLWGKSMGAVAALLRASKDRRVDACVLDSPFADFRSIVLDGAASSLAFQWIPTPMVDYCLAQVAAEVEQKAGFDPRDLQPVRDAPQGHCPAMFGSADQDSLVPPHHAQQLHEAWGGPSQLIRFEGEHNGDRPRDFLERAAKFMWESLEAAADVEEKISGAVDAYCRADSAGDPTPREGVLVGSYLSDGQEDALLRVAVDSYVEQRHSMDEAIDKYVNGRGTLPIVETSPRWPHLVPGQCVMPMPPMAEGHDTDIESEWSV